MVLHIVIICLILRIINFSLEMLKKMWSGVGNNAIQRKTRRGQGSFGNRELSATLVWVILSSMAWRDSR